MKDRDIAKEIRDKRRKREREEEEDRERKSWTNPANLTDPTNPISWVVFY